MICEVLYKIGDGGSWKDGMPVEVRQTGVYVTATEMTAWIAGSEPSSIAGLEESVRTHMRTFATLAQTFSASNFAASSLATNGVTEEQVNRAKADMDSRLAKIQAEGGVDTTWGLEELKTMGVMIADLTLEQITEITASVDQLESGKIETTRGARRRFRVPYETLLSADSIADVKNETTTVKPARGETPFTYAQLVVGTA